MRELFQQELTEVEDRLVEIARLVLESIKRATVAFTTIDVTLADQVISDDPQIDELTMGLDELAIEILYRQQPVARDLRTVVSALRMSSSLERMGDLAQHIAQIARYRYPDSVVPDSLHSTFVKMGQQDIRIAELVVELLDTQSPEIVEQIHAEDDIIDELHQSVFDQVLAPDWSGSAEVTIDAVLASRYHERFGDHATSIAKKVLYLATGDWADAEH